MAKILVIDDSTMMRRLLRSFLEGAGHEVDDWLPLSPMEIPDRLAASKVDLILTDFQMPGLNGLSVAKMAMRAAPNVPVVVLTALQDPETAAQLKKFNVSHIIYKPITAEALNKLVASILGSDPLPHRH